MYVLFSNFLIKYSTVNLSGFIAIWYFDSSTLEPIISLTNPISSKSFRVSFTNGIPTFILFAISVSVYGSWPFSNLSISNLSIDKPISFLIFIGNSDIFLYKNSSEFWLEKLICAPISIVTHTYCICIKNIGINAKLPYIALYLEILDCKNPNPYLSIKNIIVVVIPAVIADFIFTLVFGIIKYISENINAININPIIWTIKCTNNPDLIDSEFNFSTTNEFDARTTINNIGPRNIIAT